jgi:RNA-directed DNA polymerase
MAERGYQTIRYADDFVIVCHSQSEAEQALEQVRAWMTEQELTLHPEKTRIVDMGRDKASFEFLGVRFKHTDKHGDMRFPNPQVTMPIRDKTCVKPRVSWRALSRDP